MSSDVYSQLQRRLVEARDRSEIELVAAEAERLVDLGHLSIQEFLKLGTGISRRRIGFIRKEPA